MKIPTKRDREIHAFVCGQGRSIKDAADTFGVSRSTVRRSMDRVTEFRLTKFDVPLNGYDVEQVIGWLRNGNTESKILADKITAFVEGAS